MENRQRRARLSHLVIFLLRPPLLPVCPSLSFSSYGHPSYLFAPACHLPLKGLHVGDERHCVGGAGGIDALLLKVATALEHLRQKNGDDGRYR